MACVTLKRSLDFDPLHHTSCSPRPHKRRRCIPMCVSSQSAAVAAASACQTEPQSPFAVVTPKLTPEQIAQNVREEFRRLKRRKMLASGDRSMEMEGGYESPSSPPCPPSPPSPPCASPPSSSGLSSLHHQTPSNKDKPLFTFRQVNLICEQLLREREVKIREEYNKVLATKLAEQYDCFVRFTADQIQQRLSMSALPSYLS